MTRPPTRADQVRMTSAQAGKRPPRQATMTAIDMDDNLRPDAWFAYVLPIQSGVEMMGSGRYGYWDDQPEVALDDDCIVITGRSDPSPDDEDKRPGDDEPILVLPRSAVISVLVAKAKHINAFPVPQLRTEEGQQ